MLDQETIKAEKEILYFILKETAYISEVFGARGSSPKDFQDERIVKIVQIAISNFNDYSSKLVEDELVIWLDHALEMKKISQKDYANIQSVFNEVTNSDFYNLDDDQFERVFEAWRNVEAAFQLEQLLRDKLQLIKEKRGIEAISEISVGMEKIQTEKAKLDGISTLDIINDTDRQLFDIINRRKNPQNYVGIPTGLCSLDKVFNGFEKGTLTVLGGIIGSGKSTFAFNVGKRQADMEKKVLIVSLEMSIDQYARKINSMDFRLDAKGLMIGSKTIISDDDIQHFENSLRERKERYRDKEGGLKIIAAPSGECSWERLLLEIERRLPAYNPDIIWIDQLSLINLGRYSNDKKTDALGDLAADIRACAQRRNIPIVLLVQANRSSIIRTKTGKREIDINKENIEDSNKVGAHADNFLAINLLGHGEALVKVVKQREGAEDSIIIKARPDLCLFFDDGDFDVGKFDLEGQSIEDETGIDEIDNIEIEIPAMKACNLDDDMIDSLVLDEEDVNLNTKSTYKDVEEKEDDSEIKANSELMKEYMDTISLEDEEVEDFIKWRDRL